VYLFVLLFLWQMPHFWALALRYKDDYALGNFPTLPVTVGVDRTLFHTGIYTFLYIIVALAAPLFVRPSWVFLGLVFPMSVKIMLEFFKLFRSKGEKGWLSFFLWINLSILVFVFVPALDKWNFLVIDRN
jgi:heme o synthase